MREPGADERRTFVLIHGAFHGGWCWRHVTPRLQQAGHTVLTPTLTGLGDRAHLASAALTLSDHVQDIAAAIETEELEDVILVGHSYGGVLALKLADLMPQRLRRLIFLDATIARSGETLLELYSPDNRAIVRSMVVDGFVRPPPPEVFGVDQRDTATIAWMKRRLRPHPLASWEEPIEISRSDAGGLPGSYIYCTEHHSEIMDRAVSMARSWGWPIYELAAGHDPMITHPAELVDILLKDSA